ncbi:MAG: hypothetical protein JSW14_00060 [Candidatus Bathyarchaeum sp.]|nr:MAG: hypothetical protein JSW14_00060 [Candidatus Bathyarchaeum sp.]
MKRTQLVITLILALSFSLAAGLPAIKEAEANPTGMAMLFWRDIIVVQSPQNKTYNVETLPLNFTVESLDENQLPTRYTLNKKKVDVWTPVVSKIINTASDWIIGTSQNDKYKLATFIVQYNSILSNLADGTYKLTVKRYSANPIKVVSSATVHFTIDTNLVDTAIIPEFPSWAPMLFMLLAVVAVAVIYRRYLPKYNQGRREK